MTQTSFKNATAIGYVFMSYILGIALILSPSWQLNTLGVAAIVHSLAISTALTHEFIHGNIFKSRALNAWWGQVMTHFNGACYAPWENLVEHHFNHHLHHVDIVRFDVIKYLNQDLHPWLRSIYVGLEWLYFPLLEFEIRWRIIFDPLLDVRKQSLLGRTIGLMVLRTAVFGLLAWVSWKALLLYFLAYISFVNLMRFIDAFHHTYTYAVSGENFPKLDRLYEQTNTFSNLVSVKYHWLNLLFLNFGYHNAHHHNMSCPWHELPALHAKLYGDTDRGLLPLSQLIGNYHRFRIQRLCSSQGELNAIGKIDLDTFVGGVAVSLLTPP
ncbi:MAG: fatty acid desaturase [Chamaesiphon sp.]|nr:fatty acid desaturase [Chamaesiphon sp.]